MSTKIPSFIKRSARAGNEDRIMRRLEIEKLKTEEVQITSPMNRPPTRSSKFGPVSMDLSRQNHITQSIFETDKQRTQRKVLQGQFARNVSSVLKMESLHEPIGYQAYINKTLIRSPLTNSQVLRRRDQLRKTQSQFSTKMTIAMGGVPALIDKGSFKEIESSSSKPREIQNLEFLSGNDIKLDHYQSPSMFTEPKIFGARNDITELGRWMDSQLQQIDQSDQSDSINIFKLKQVIMTAAMGELQRQVKVECKERGDLMRMIWDWQMNMVDQMIEQLSRSLIQIEKRDLINERNLHQAYQSELDALHNKLKQQIQVTNDMNRQILLYQKEQQYLYKKEDKLNRQISCLNQQITRLLADFQQQVRENLNLLTEGFGLDWDVVVDIKRDFYENRDYREYSAKLHALNTQIILQSKNLIIAQAREVIANDVAKQDFTQIVLQVQNDQEIADLDNHDDKLDEKTHIKLIDVALDPIRITLQNNKETDCLGLLRVRSTEIQASPDYLTIGVGEPIQYFNTDTQTLAEKTLDKYINTDLSLKPSDATQELYNQQVVMMDNDCQTVPFIDEGIRISVYNLDDEENEKSNQLQRPKEAELLLQLQQGPNVELNQQLTEHIEQIKMELQFAKDQIKKNEKVNMNLKQQVIGLSFEVEQLRTDLEKRNHAVKELTKDITEFQELAQTHMKTQTQETEQSVDSSRLRPDSGRSDQSESPRGRIKTMGQKQTKKPQNPQIAKIKQVQGSVMMKSTARIVQSRTPNTALNDSGSGAKSLKTRQVGDKQVKVPASPITRAQQPSGSGQSSSLQPHARSQFQQIINQHQQPQHQPPQTQQQQQPIVLSPPVSNTIGQFLRRRASSNNTRNSHFEVSSYLLIQNLPQKKTEFPPMKMQQMYSQLLKILQTLCNELVQAYRKGEDDFMQPMHVCLYEHLFKHYGLTSMVEQKYNHFIQIIYNLQNYDDLVASFYHLMRFDKISFLNNHYERSKTSLIVEHIPQSGDTTRMFIGLLSYLDKNQQMATCSNFGYLFTTLERVSTIDLSLLKMLRSDDLNVLLNEVKALFKNQDSLNVFSILLVILQKISTITDSVQKHIYPLLYTYNQSISGCIPASLFYTFLIDLENFKPMENQFYLDRFKMECDTTDLMGQERAMSNRTFIKFCYLFNLFNHSVIQKTTGSGKLNKLVSDVNLVAQGQKVIKTWQQQGKIIKWHLFSLQFYRNSGKQLIYRLEQIIQSKEMLYETVILIWEVLKKEMERAEEEHKIRKFLCQDLILINNLYTNLSYR